MVRLAGIVAGGEKENINGYFGLVDELSGSREIVGVDDRVSGCGGEFYSGRF